LEHRSVGDSKMENPAELFEAISHPIRIKILKILENNPSSFASLKRELGISSSGNLDHHLKKLGQLIDMQKDGLYGLNDNGKEALVSVGAVESWTKTENRKMKKVTKLPKEVTCLVVLVSAVAFTAVLLLGAINFVDYVWPFFTEILGMVGFLGSLSVVGILQRKSWSWSLTVVQAVLFLGFIIFPICYTATMLSNLQDGNIVQQSMFQQRYDLPAYQPIPEFIQRWAGYVVVGIVEALVLFVALKPNVREFFRMQNVTSNQKRVLVAGMLVMLVGMLECHATTFYMFQVPLPRFSYFTAFVIFLGGIALLMQKYTLGGLISITFSFLMIPYCVPLWSLFFDPNIVFDLPVSPLIPLIIVTTVSVMPAVAALLIRTNLKTALSDFFSQIWR
jgi:DNA-binding HxlR family transcriptional regulator